MVTENKASDKFTGRVLELLRDAKRNTQWRKQYMEWEREKTYIREDAIEEGREQGAQAKAVEAARNMLNLKVGTIEQVAQITGLSVEQVLQLQQKR